MASIDKITPDDSRITHKHTTLNGRKYHYLLSKPENGQVKGTIILIHGFPDLSLAWRYQIPFLTGLGFQVAAPDMMGYGGTDAPQVPPESMHLYGFKRASDDIVALAKELNAPKIILGGHDWGGMVVYRAAQWHPELVSHVFSVCTPFFPNGDKFFSTHDLVQGPVPQFGYQLQFAGPEPESKLQTKDQFVQLFKAMFGGRTESGNPPMRPETGLDFGVLEEKIGDSPLVDAKEIEYYAEQYARNGFHGPCNWYRTREANFEDERKLGPRTIDQPTLYILATKDNILTRELASGMEAFISKLSRREVATGHWALWQAPSEVNGYIKEWLDTVVYGGKSTL